MLVVPTFDFVSYANIICRDGSVLEQANIGPSGFTKTVTVQARLHLHERLTFQLGQPLRIPLMGTGTWQCPVVLEAAGDPLIKRGGT